MRTVSVITGGAGGMDMAKVVGRDQFVVISDVRQDRLDDEVSKLEKLDIVSTAVVCDITDRKSVAELVETSAGAMLITR
jgi:short-subunit dehydrogenase involved in D-alanine esterification of teichoic acids